MDDRPLEHLRALLDDFDTAMLVTRTPSGELRSRPMAVADKAGDAELWFVTSLDSGKVDEIATDGHVNVTMQSTAAFISISGQAQVVRDQARLAELWQERWKVWFPEGKDEPSAALLRVRPEQVEYWDVSGTKGVRHVWEAAKAYARGSRPEAAKGVHGSLKIH